jgi:hypothetical protein
VKSREPEMGFCHPIMRYLSSFLFLLCVLLFSSPGMASGNVYHGNWASRIYHNSTCKYFTCKRCTVNFSSAGEAEASGYRACKVCGGGTAEKREAARRKEDSARQAGKGDGSAGF